MPNGLYLNFLDRSISRRRVVQLVFIITVFYSNSRIFDFSTSLKQKVPHEVFFKKIGTEVSEEKSFKGVDGGMDGGRQVITIVHPQSLAKVS